jgi:thiamine biosynthesis protein ThiI
MSYTGRGVVLRHGELFLKGSNRYMFEEALEGNVRKTLEHRPDIEVVRKHGRIFVLGACDSEVMKRLHEVFGVSSLSPAVFCEKDVDEIAAKSLELAGERPPGAKTFRISARRSDKRFSQTSADLGRIAGAAVVEKYGLEVDLENYDWSIGIEVGADWCFLWTTNEKGAGGLPVGTGGKALLLISGGIDSPVAGYMIQKRGVEISACYFHSFPYTGENASEKVKRLAKILAGRQGNLRLFKVPFTRIQEELRDRAEAKSLVLFYRRAMVKIAETIAKRYGIKALITGESLGQVASQTLQNLTVIEDAAELPILRPLIGFDKAETIELAKKIGTYEISILPHDDCCSLFVPKHPETKASLRRIRFMENQMDLQPLLDEAVDKVDIIEL